MKNIPVFALSLLSVLNCSFAQDGKVTFLYKRTDGKTDLTIFRNSQATEGSLPPFHLTANQAQTFIIPCPLFFYTADDNAIPIYARPGDSIVIAKKNETLAFDIRTPDGVRNNEQALLLDLFNQFGPLYGRQDREAMYKGPDKEAYIKERYQQKVALIDSFQGKKQLSPTFENFLKNYFFYRQLNLLIRERMEAEKDLAGILPFLREEFTEIDWNADNDASLLQVDSYRSFISIVASLNARINPSAPQRIRKLMDHFSGQSRDLALFLEIQKINSTKADSSQTALDIFLKNCTDTRYTIIVTGEQKLNDDVAAASGSDLVLLTDEQTLPLKSLLEKRFANKIVLIDFWASWCGPCIEEFPFYDKLVAKYKADTSVVFAFISMDATKNDWRTAAIKYSFLNKSNSYLLAKNFDSRFAQQHQIISIPRTMVMYQNKMHLTDAPRPSDGGKLEKIIKELKNKQGR